MIGPVLTLLAFATPVAATQLDPVQTVVPAPATAPDADRVEAAMRLLTVIKVERQYDSMLGQMVPLITRQMFDQIRDAANTPPAIRRQMSDPAKLEELRAVFIEEIRREFQDRYPQMKRETAIEYANLFTVQELTGLTNFYESAVGQKALSTLPALTQKLFPIGVRIGADAGQAAMATTLKRVSLAPKRPNS